MRARVLVAVLAAACGGGDSMTGPPPPTSATQLSVVTQPSASVQNGVAIPVQPAVRLRDAQNRPVALAGVVVTASLVSGTGASLSGATASTDASGIATFTGLTLTGTVGTFTMRFSAPTLAPVDANPITLTAGVPTALALTTEPSSAAQAGTELAVQPSVQLRDASGNSAGQSGVTITAQLVSGSATITGATAVTNAAGLATFSGLALSGTVGSYTLRFVATGLTSATAAAATMLAAGPATQLALVTQPGATAVNGAALAVQPAVQLRDAFGNDAIQAGVKIAASVVTGPAGSSIAGDTAQTDAAGRATFTTLGITGAVGSYTLRFAATGFTSVVSGGVTLTPGAATKLGIVTGASTSAQSGVALATQPAVQVQDQSGNAVAQAGVVVTAGVVSGTVTLTGNTATTDAAGKATFTSLTLSGTVNLFLLQFSAPGLGNVSGTTTLLNPGPASQLALTTQPAFTATNAVALTRQPVVRLQDAQGNAVPTAGVVVTASLVNGSAVLGSSTATTGSGGSATFSGLSLTGLVGSYTLRFTAASPGVAPVDASSATVLAAGAASQAVLVTEPGTAAQSGVALAPQPAVQLRDVSGNDVPQAGVGVIAAVVGGGAAVTGASVTTNAAGRAAFTALALSGPTGSYALRFTAGALPSVDAAAGVTLGAGPASTLTLSTQPSTSAASGAALAIQPVVQVRDAAGNAVGAAGVVVTATVVSGTATLTSATATTNAGGTASFSGLTVSATVGNYTLRFGAPGLASVDAAAPLALGAGAATQLTLSVQPATAAQSGVALTSQPVVQIRDAAGNAVPQQGVSVTASVVSGSATFAGGTVITDVNGTATFSTLSVAALAGSYTLRFSATGLAAVTASAPTVVSAGPAAQLTFTTAPSGSSQSGMALAAQPQVQVRDGAGNPVATAGVTVTASVVGGGPAVTGATAVTGSGGAATFAGLTLTGTIGTYVLRFSASGLTLDHAGFVLGAGPPASISIVTPPPATAVNGMPISAPPAVLVRDAQNNPVAGVTTSVAATFATLTNAGATTGVNGQAVFSGLTLTGTASGYNLRFCVGSDCNVATLVVSSAVAMQLLAGAPANLTLPTQPSGSAQSGVALATQPEARVTDISGNPVAGVTVVAAVAGATVTGGSAMTDASGTATFTTLTVSGVPASYTLTLSSGAASASRPLALAVGPPAVVTLQTAPPTGAANGVLFTPQPVVVVTDGSGNPVPTVGVTASVGAGAVVSQATVQTNATGTAAFTSLGLTGAAGPYTVTFSAGAASASAPVTLAAGTAASLALSVGAPASAQNGVPIGTPPVVHVADGSANPVPGAIVTASLVSGSLALTNEVASTDASGDATFTGLTLAGAVGSYTLRFTTGSLAPVDAPAPTNLVAGPAARLAMVAQPSPTATNAQVLIAQPAVRITDAGGEFVSQSNTTVTATLVAGSAVVGSATAVTNASGIATFSGLKLTGTVGSYQLRFGAPGLQSVDANATTLSPGTATQLALTAQPSQSGVTGQALAQPPVVQLRDVSGNAVGQAGVNVTIAATAGTPTFLGATTVATDGAGVATFAGLGVTTPRGRYLLRVTSGGLTAATAADTTVIASPLAVNTPVVTGGTVLTDSAYAIVVPAGLDSLVITTSGGGSPSDDADLVVRFGAAPDIDRGLFDCYSGSASNAERCTIVAPPAGTYYVSLYAFFSFSNVTLTVRTFP